MGMVSTGHTLQMLWRRKKDGRSQRGAETAKRHRPPAEWEAQVLHALAPPEAGPNNQYGSLYQENLPAPDPHFAGMTKLAASSRSSRLRGFA
jgi:hypothetical protein